MSEAVVPAAAGERRLRATLVGGIAVLLWATLALLTTAAQPVPPFQLVALTFAIAFLLALGKWTAARLGGGAAVLSHLRQPAAVWALGVGGLFGYHFFYFTALARAPSVDASLIAYLWPLLIVLLSALLPGERLRWWHVAGGIAGLVGAGLLVTQNAGGGVAFRAEFALGYLAALACAFTWSVYSVLSRRFGRVPSDAVGGFCGVTAALGLLCHLAFEETRWPDLGGWLAVLALGLGPVGAAFFVWDYGVKRGDIKALGAFAYAAPLLSTLLLIVFGRAAATWTVAAACALIVGGAALAGGDLWRRAKG
jgi:drug/metabolite transporter (DMT)-like permease